MNMCQMTEANLLLPSKGLRPGKGAFTVTNSCKTPESGGVNEWS